MNTEIEPAVLHTGRLLLRPFLPRDIEDLFAFLSDEEYAFFGLAGQGDRDDVEMILANILDTQWHDRPRFAAVLEERVVGDISLRIDHPNLTADLGYGIAREHWGKGLATEAARAVLDYGFNTFNLAKVSARIDPRNIRSMRVVEKLGMKKEGLLRSQLIRRGERVDRAYYGLLREEWEATK